METKKTITLLGKELTISQIYKTRAHVNEEYTGKAEAIEIDIRELTNLITSEEDAERLAEEMSEYIHNEVYNDCKAKADEGEPLYAYRTLMIDLIYAGMHNRRYITASAMYVECEDICECCFSFDDENIERKDEEDEEGNKIEDNVKYNAILDVLKREEFTRQMSEGERNEFERLKKEARIEITNVQDLRRAEKEGLIKELHTSLFRGYVSRVKGQTVEPYKGRFGEGVKLLSCNHNSTRYSYVTYYIYTKKRRK